MIHNSGDTFHHGKKGMVARETSNCGSRSVQTKAVTNKVSLPPATYFLQLNFTSEWVYIYKSWGTNTDHEFAGTVYIQTIMMIICEERNYNFN